MGACLRAEQPFAHFLWGGVDTARSPIHRRRARATFFITAFLGRSGTRLVLCVAPRRRSSRDVGMTATTYSCTSANNRGGRPPRRRRDVSYGRRRRDVGTKDT